MKYLHLQVPVSLQYISPSSADMAHSTRFGGMMGSNSLPCFRYTANEISLSSE